MLSHLYVVSFPPLSSYLFPNFLECQTSQNLKQITPQPGSYRPGYVATTEHVHHEVPKPRLFEAAMRYWH